MPGSDRDRLTVARIAGVALRHARGGPVTGLRQAAALAELAEVADGRVDLLAEYAGLVLGFHEDDGEAELYQRVAQLCIDAGADIPLIGEWADEGRRRAAAAARVPYYPGRRPGR